MIYPLRTRFLSALERWHGQHAYSRDVETLARAVNARLMYSTTPSRMVVFGQRPMITVQTFDSPHFVPSRMLFHFLHELSHILVSRLEGGAIARAFHARYSGFPRSYHTVLEGLCNRGAAQLLMPDHALERAVGAGVTPQAVLNLSSATGASWSAALRRVLHSVTLEVWGLLIRLERLDGDTWTATGQDSVYVGPLSAYPQVRGLRLDFEHPLMWGDAAYRAVNLERVPFAPWGGPRPYLAASSGNQRFRRVCLFVFRGEG